MKKLLVVALVALMAGTAFAATDPAFSGTFEFYNTWNFDEKEIVAGGTQNAEINLNGVVDEWSTVTATFGISTYNTTEMITAVTPIGASPIIPAVGNIGAYFEIAEGDTVYTTADTYEEIEEGSDYFGVKIYESSAPDVDLATLGGTLTPGTKIRVDGVVGDDDDGEALTLNEFTMTTDITGALGIVGPVGVSLTWGKTEMEPASYHTVAGYEDLEVVNPTDSYLGAKVSITIIEKLKLITAIYPTTYHHADGWNIDDDPVFAIELQAIGLIEGLNFNAFYTMDPNQDNDDDTSITEETDEIGLTIGYTMSPVAMGLATKYDFFLEELSLGASFVYMANFGLNAGLSFGSSDLTGDFEGSSQIGFNISYALVKEVLNVVAALKLPFSFESEDIGFEGALEASLGNVKYILGYEHNQVNFKSPNGDDSTGLFFFVKADF